MTTALALLQRMERNARVGRGLRLSPEEIDLLRAIIELSEAHAQAHAVDQDDSGEPR